MTWWLWLLAAWPAAAALLAALSAYALRRWGVRVRDTSDDHDHDHRGTSR